MNKICLAIFVFGFLLVSCEKEIKFKGEGKQALLVLDAILENHKNPSVHLSRSVFFLSKNTDSSSKDISGATIILTNLDLNESYTLINTPATGIYTGNVPILPNTNYKIVVSYPNYQTISSQLKTVKDVELTDIDTSSVFIKQFGQEYRSYNVNAHFKDLNDKNFYSINLKSYLKKDSYDSDSIYLTSDTSYIQNYINSNDPSIKFYHYYNIFLTDSYFQGQFKVFPMNFTFMNTFETDYQTGGYFSYKILKLQASIVSMTEDTFTYFESFKNNQGGNPFSDPSNVFTNIENGLGIFGSVSTDFKEK